MPQRWVWYTVTGALALCLIGGTLGIIMVWRLWGSDDSPQQQKVSQAVANSLQVSISTRISHVPPAVPVIHLTDADLYFDNTINREGSGIETYSIGVVILGFTTSITSDGIVVRSGGEIAYSGRPVVEDGRIEMTRVEAFDPELDRLLTGRGFEEAFETAFERSMMISGRQPTGIELGNGTLTIHTMPSR